VAGVIKSTAILIPKGTSLNEICGWVTVFLVAVIIQIFKTWKGGRIDVVVLGSVAQARYETLCTAPKPAIMGLLEHRLASKSLNNAVSVREDDPSAM